MKLLSEIDVLDNASTTFHRQAQKVSIYSFLVLSYTPCDLSNISTIYKALISNKIPFLLCCVISGFQTDLKQKKIEKVSR